MRGTDYTLVSMQDISSELDEDEIGMGISGANNSHLDEMQARILLKLEWNALEKAVMSKGRKRAIVISDALNFRTSRQNLYEGAQMNESNLEMNEGLAEYTGLVLSHLKKKEKLEYIKNRLPGRKNVPSYVRSFAYISGPLYGLLLDEKDSNWQKKIKPDADFGVLLSDAYSIQVSSLTNDEIKIIANNYQYTSIIDYEQKREDQRIQLLKEMRSIFVKGRVLTLKFQNMSIQFNPTNLIPLDDIGTIYPTMKVVDKWGILEVNQNALLSKNWDFVKVAAETIDQHEDMVKGSGWTLQLNDGWVIVDDGNNKIVVKND